MVLLVSPVKLAFQARTDNKRPIRTAYLHFRETFLMAVQTIMILPMWPQQQRM